jgi:small subunit ribosomal protein S6
MFARSSLMALSPLPVSPLFRVFLPEPFQHDPAQKGLRAEASLKRKGELMPRYEHVFLARQDITAQQANALQKQYQTVIEENGGTVGKTEYWGLKSLSYKIKKNRKAHYTLMNIEAPHTAVAEMERQMSIAPDVLRLHRDQYWEQPSECFAPAQPSKHHRHDCQLTDDREHLNQRCEGRIMHSRPSAPDRLVYRANRRESHRRKLWIGPVSFGIAQGVVVELEHPQMSDRVYPHREVFHIALVSRVGQEPDPHQQRQHQNRQQHDPASRGARLPDFMGLNFKRCFLSR